MASNLDGGEFWLPSEFLVEQLLMDEDSENRAALLPNASSPGSGSNRSLAESTAGSTDAESDEDDILAGLTWQMAHSMLPQVNKPDPRYLDGDKTERIMSSSPQSTLCTSGIWGMYVQDQRGSNGSSPPWVPSPPLMPFTGKDEALYLLPTEARHAGSLKGILGLPKSSATSVDYRPVQPLTSYLSKSLQNENLKQQQQQLLEKQGSWPRGRQQPRQHNNIINNGRSQVGSFSRPMGLSSSAWPALQHHQQQQRRHEAGSGMRAVFLEGSVARKESSGTGVFLPRQVGSSADFRKRPACSAVLVPARVVQALNLNLDEMGPVRSQTRPSSVQKCNSGFSTVRSNAYALGAHRGRNAVHPHMVTSQDICLPQEWTY